MKKMMIIQKERRRKEMKKMMRKEEGFTLVELLIVVIILGILAAVAIPQFGSSTDDAKLSTLTSNLSSLRNAMELYKQEHDNVYPGIVAEDGTTPATAVTCPQAFDFQLTRYTDVTGLASVDYVAGKKGPYVKKGLPENPFNNDASVECDNTVNDITTTATTGGSGWIFYMRTGKLLANDGSHGTL